MFENYMKAGFNPCTISELKNRLDNGYYDKQFSNGNETITVKDELLMSLITQIDRIANVTD